MTSTGAWHWLLALVALIIRSGVALNNRTAAADMPRCEGLPDGPCPGKSNDSSVKLGEGDLMLCHDCDQVRFQGFLAAQKKAVEPKSVQNEKKAVQLENVKKAVTSLSAEVNSRGSNSCSVFLLPDQVVTMDASLAGQRLLLYLENSLYSGIIYGPIVADHIRAYLQTLCAKPVLIVIVL